MKPLRILMLITNLGLGGAQRVFRDHALALAAFAQVEEAVFDLHREARVFDSGLPLRGLPRSPWLSRLGAPGRLLARALALRQLAHEQQYDVVISHMDGANWVNVLSGSRARKILVVHGTIIADGNIRGWKQWLRLQVIFPFLYNTADRTVAVSEGIARELREAGSVRNVETIPNFFDLRAIETQARAPLPNEWADVFAQGNILVTSGRLAEQKKQVWLIDVLADMRLSGSNARLLLLGDGDLRQTLLARCAEKGLRAYSSWDPAAALGPGYDVYFAGHVTNPYQFLARSTVFVFPSGWEGFPLALCEALACGVPAVSTDCPTGPREILAPATPQGRYDLRESEAGPNGILMPLFRDSMDVRVWVQTLHNLLADRDQRVRLAASGRQAVQVLDRSRVVQRWRSLVQDIAQ